MTTNHKPAALSAHHRALITWLAVYPTITITLALIGPAMSHLPLLLRTLALTLVVVPVTVYVLVPALTQASHALTTRLVSQSTSGENPRSQAATYPAWGADD
ncbi:hypothetical protein [Nocardia terrae]|uniref:hypothetical protein n=1 Tax=Nocardia terrae TaxID=2675851 RepID=UPI0018DF8741|nr:hypothetical protein [Nocardia terrae]